MARLDKLEHAIYALDDAISAIEALGKHSETDVMCLRDMQVAYKFEIEEINERLAADDDASMAALEREYWQSK